MTSRFAGKLAVVTGAASGIGREAALLLGREQCSVIAVDRDRTGNEAVGEDLRQSLPPVRRRSRTWLWLRASARAETQV